MNRYVCSICSKTAELSCDCSSIQYFCEKCAMTHVKIRGLTHKFSYLSNEDSTQILVNSLQKALSTIREQQETIIKETYYSIELLNLQTIKSLNLLKDAENTIKSTILSVLACNFSDILEYFYNILQLDVDSAKSITNSWNLTELQIDSTSLNSCITNWSSVKLNFFYEESNASITHDFESDLSKIQISRKFSEPFSTGNPKPKISEPVSSARKNDPARSLLKPLECTEGHILKWSHIALFREFNLDKCYNLKCNLCSKVFSDRSWNCECNYNVCEECGFKLGYQRPKVICSNRHELTWECGLANMNNKCFQCKISINQQCWACIKCGFYVCLDCGETAGLESITESFLCARNHQLESTITDKTNDTCSYCQKIIKGVVFQCKACSYYLCQICIEFKALPTAPHPIISCANSHILKWHDIGSFKCDFCKNRFQESRFKCKPCNYDVCLQCSRLIENFIRSSRLATDSFNHELVWMSLPNSLCTKYKPHCSKCFSVFDTKGSLFYCRPCHLFFCINCQLLNKLV